MTTHESGIRNGPRALRRWIGAVLTAVPPLFIGRSATAAQVPKEVDYEIVQWVGTESGPLSFTGITAVVASDSLLAIVDRGACQVAVYNVLTRRFVRRIGGCGRGPGEFAEQMMPAWRRDTLYVADSRSVSVFSPAGEFVRMERLSLGPYSPVVAMLEVIDDSTFFVGVGLVPLRNISAVTDPAAYNFLAEVDRRTGQVRRRHLSDRSSWFLSRTPIAGRELFICRAGRTAGSSWFTLLPWRFEAIQLRIVDGVERLTTVHAADVRGMTQVDPRSDLDRKIGYVSVACNDDQVLFKWSDHRVSPKRGYLVLASSAGTVVGARRLVDSDSVLMGHAAGIIGDQFFLWTNQLGDHPMVIGVRFRPAR